MIKKTGSLKEKEQLPYYDNIIMRQPLLLQIQLIFAIVLFQTPTTAQTLLKAGVGKIDNLIAFADDSGVKAVYISTVVGDKFINSYDSNANQLGTIKVPSLTFLGIQSNNSFHTIYAKSRVRKKEFHVISLPKQSGLQSQIHILPDIEDSEDLIVTFVKNNIFFLLTYSKQDNAIFVRRYLDQQHVTKSKFTFNKDLVDMVKSNGEFVDQDNALSFHIVKNKAKFFLQGDNKIIFTNDKDSYQRSQIEITTLDLDTQATNTRFIDLTVPAATHHNSFLIDDKLFVLSVWEEFNSFVLDRKFNLFVLDYKTGSEIKKIHYNKDEVIAIKKSALVRDGLNIDSLWNEDEKTKKILQLFVGKTPVIGVKFLPPNTYKLLLGCDYYSSDGMGRIISYELYFLGLLDSALNCIDGITMKTVSQKINDFMNSVMKNVKIDESTTFQSTKDIFFIYKPFEGTDLILHKIGQK
jgi:hypothetical protein